MVVGEDFWLRIPMNNESAGRHLCMDDVEVIHAWLESGYGGCWTLPLETDGEQLEGVAVKVPGSRLGLGTYAVVMAGKFVNGGHFRTKRQLFIRLVDREEQADAKPTMFNEEKAYWAGPAVLSGMLSRDGLNTYELAVLHGYDGTLEQFLAQAGLELQDLMVTKQKLSREVQTQLDKGSEKAINPAGDYDDEAEYSVNEMVYDEETNSSYVSKQSVNVGNAVTDTDWWMKVLDGNYVQTTIQAIMTAAQETLDEAKQDTIDATAAALAAKQDTEQATAAANAVVAQKVADAQIGYYECNTAAGTATKATTTNTIGQSTFAVPVKGCIVKVKMANANTATDTVYLQFGSDANTKKELKYNGLAVDASNTWEDGEVISVYYDGTYYQASNAMGGGSAVGKKRLTGKTGYVNLTGETAPAPTTSGGSSGQYRYIEYPVHEGDVIYIKGVSGGVLAYTWGLLDSTNNRAIVESAGGIVDYTQKPFVKVIPSGVDTIVINNYNTAYPNYEWYFAKKDSAGAHEILTEQYIYEDVRTLAVGKEYELNEAVKNDGNLMLKTLREVKAMNLTDEVSVGDLKSYGTGANAVTYQALKAVRLYDGNIVYSEGDYAIGRPTIISFAINDSSLSISEDTTFVITIGNKDYVIAVNSSSTAESIAASISSLYVEGWSLSSNGGTVVMTSIEAGTAVVSISITDENETGVSIDTPESTDGASTLSQYDGSIWNEVTLATWAADSEGETAMWKSLSVEDLIRYCEQNSIRKDIDDSTIEYRNYTPQASEFKRFKKSGNGYTSANNRVCVLLPKGTKSVTFDKINKNYHASIQEWNCKTYPTSLSTLNGTFANDSGWIEATSKPIRVNTHPDIANVAVLCIGAVSDSNFTGETCFLNVSLSCLAPYNTQNDLKELQKNVDGEESIILVTDKDTSEYNWTKYNASTTTRGRYFINLGNYEYDSCRIKFNVKDGSPIKVGASLIYNIYDYNNYAYDSGWIQGGYGREFDLSAAGSNPFRYVVFNTTYVSQDTVATTFEEFIRYCNFEVEFINHTGGMKSDVRQLQKSGKCLIASTDIKIVAHRGFHLDNVPENSIDAYRWAGFLGYNLVETDFCPTSDDELVLMHDASINRTMRNADYTAISETVNVNSKTLDELRSNYVLASNEKRYRRPIPTLEEYFIACKEGGLFALPEIKNAGTTTEHVLAAYEMGKSIMGEDRFGFCSFSYALLDYARSLSDKLQLWYIGNSILNTTNTVTNQSRNTPETVWYPQYDGSHGFTAAKVKQYHALNMKVAVWNVPVGDFDKMLKANVDYIATDYVGSNLLHTEGEVYNEYDMETNGIKTEGIILPSGKYARIVGDIMEIGIYYISIISNGKYVLKAPNLSVTINDSVPTRHIFQGLIDNKNASFTITATTDSEIQFANIKVVKVK